MAIPWIRGVQETGRLSVFQGPGFRGAPAWGPTLFQEILDEFNRLAAANRFGVRVTVGQAAPDGKGGGANIQVETTNGSHTFLDSGGTPATGKLDVTPGKMKGITHGITFGKSPSDKLAWSWVFVPINPVLGVGQRGLGKGPKMGLALHELLHACGLSETDAPHRSSSVPGDIFKTGAIVDVGSTPDQDKFVFGPSRQPDASGRFTLSSNTVSLVQSVWLFGQF